MQRAAVYVNPSMAGTGAEPPVLLAGPASGETSVADALRGILGNRIFKLQPQLTCPANFPVSEFAANLGVAAAHQNRRRAAGRCGDLLPERYRSRLIPLWPAAAVSVLLLLAALAFNLTIQAGDVSRDVDSLSARVETLEVRDRQLRLEASSARVLQEKTLRAEASTNAVRSYLGTVDGQVEFLTRSLDALAREALPPGLVLSNIAPVGPDLQVVGVAPSFEGVLEYAENLRASPYFAGAEATGAQAPGGAAQGPGRVSFRIIASR